jgi:simple sugar transport system permease protein
MSRNRRALSALAILITLWVLFLIFAPETFTNPQSYKAIFTTLPISIILAVPLVFIVAAGEIDLSFPSIFGLAAFAFAKVAEAGISPVIGLLAALVVGALAGFLNGLLVTRARLSSLVSTLGMNFLIRGLINLITQGIGIPLTFLADTPFYQVFAGEIAGIPSGVFWAILVVAIGFLLFNRHQFGAHVCIVGDNPESAKEMGIDVARTKTQVYMLIGVCAGLAGVMSSLLNTTFWPTAGDGYLLPTLAAVFIGGTPTWGGVGTIIGAAIGAITVGFIDTGLIGAGLTAFYTQFAYGLVIILSLLGHRFNQARYR